VWPFDANAMKDKVVHSTLAPSIDITTSVGSPPPPTNILIPNSASSRSANPPVIISSTTEAATVINLQPASPVIDSSLVSSILPLSYDAMAMNNMIDLPKPVMFDLNQNQPIQPIIIDDDDLPSSCFLSYETLEPVELIMPAIKRRSTDGSQSPRKMIKTSYASSSGNISN
jgi:hypothetical protein